MSFCVVSRLLKLRSKGCSVITSRLLRKVNYNAVKDALCTNNLIGTDLTLKGWVKRHRVQKKYVFLHIVDGSSLIPLQVIASQSLIDSELSYGCCVEVKGTLVESPAKGQPVELQAQKVSVIGPCDTNEYQLKFKQNHSMNYLRDYIHLRNRTDTFSALMRVRNLATRAIHQYYEDHGYLQVHTPILTSNDCEGAGEVFTVEPSNKDFLSEDVTEDQPQSERAPTSDSTCNSDDERVNPHFFNVPAYLTVSGQLHLEVMTGSFQRVYTFSPTFRAENSRGRHHLSEFYMVEAERAFTKDIEDICQPVEDLVKQTTEAVLDKGHADVDYFCNNFADENHMVKLEKLIEKPFIRLEYSDAIKLLQDHQHQGQFEFKPEWGHDLQREHEKWLVSYCDHYPVFIVNFPESIKPFYARSNDDGKTVATFDLLTPGVGEVCGGSLREERYDIISSRVHRLQLHHKLDWYLDLRRFGSAPHGGYGLGFERYLQTLLGISNIKDTIPFPRWSRNCKL